MLRTKIIEHPSELSSLRPLWDELCARQSGSMFQSFAWNETAARVFASREPIRVVVVENDAGAAIVPACVNLNTGRIGLIGETLFDYRDVLAPETGLLSVAWQEIAGWAMDLEVAALRGEWTTRWEEFVRVPFAKAPVILRESMTAEQFVRGQNRLGRHSRRLRKQGIDVHRYPGSHRALIDTIYRRKGERGESLFSDPLRREFMLEICARPETHCEVFTYETAGELVAALVTFRDDSVRRFYTIYFDQRWESLSPGQVLLFEVAAKSLQEGLGCDFMTGEYPYKLRLATDSVPLYRAAASPSQIRDAARRIAPSITLAA